MATVEEDFTNTLEVNRASLKMLLEKQHENGKQNLRLIFMLKAF